MFDEAGAWARPRSASSSASRSSICAAMMKHKDETVAANVNGVAFLLQEEQDRRLYRATGRIAAPGKVEVNGEDGTRQMLETKAIVIATGSDVAPLPGVEIDEKTHRLLDRRAGAGEGPGEAHRGRRRRDRARTRLGLAAARRGGDGRRIPRPHPARHGRRNRQAVPAHAGKAGLGIPARPQGRPKVEKARTGVKATIEPAAGGEAADARGRRRAGRDRPASLSPKASASRRSASRSKRGQVVIDDHFATNVPGIYAIGDVVARADAGPQGRGRRRRGRRDPRRPGRPRELQRHSRRGLHEPGNRLGRQDRGRAEGRRHRLQGRQVPLHRQRPRARDAPHRRLREDPRRRRDRPGARRRISSASAPAR